MITYNLYDYDWPLQLYNTWKCSMYYCENSRVYYYLCVLFIPLFLGHFVEKTTKLTGSYDSIDEVIYALESCQRWVGSHCMTLHLLSKLLVSRFVLLYCVKICPLFIQKVVIYVYMFFRSCPFLDLYCVKICPLFIQKLANIWVYLHDY